MLFLVSSLVFAAEKEDDLLCLQCGDSCAPADFVAVASCLQPTRDFECGVENGKCVILEPQQRSFGDDKELGDDDFFDDIDDDFTEDELEDIKNIDIGTGGIGPDSPLYFIDEIFAQIFGEDREEKIAEIKTMVEKGNFEAAKIALRKYKDNVKLYVKEVRPENRENAKREAATIRHVLGNIEKNIRPEEREEFARDFTDEIIESERSIVTAVEVANKIKELCETLSELDPLEYSRTCKTEDDSPEWKKELDEKLTEDQRNEAKNFFGIMTSCFNNPRECECDKIKIESFSEKCKIIAPLAADCEEGDESACDKMDDMEDPIDLLPPHLQRVMESLEDDLNDAEFDNHMPRECIKEGATSREECFKVMFRIHAPDECIEAMDRGAIDASSEKSAKEGCDEIMFRDNAPSECIEAGLTDHEDCEKLMFEVDSPQECLDAGFDGSGRNDRQNCERLMWKTEAPRECIEAGLTGENRNDWEKCDAIRFRLEADQACLDAGLDGSGRDDWKKCEAISFRHNAPQECLDAGIDGSGRDDWKKCEAINFKLDAPQECLDAGYDGSGRDDWKKCDAIKFELDAPPECIAAGIRGSDRDAWDRCNIIKFKLEAPRECLEAGFDGTGRNDWKECDIIKFEIEAPQECLDAGIRGTDRDAWDKCNQLQFKLDMPQECIDAGLDGSGDNDRYECDAIVFKKDAPQECIDAGFDGSGRNDWRECDKIRIALEDAKFAACEECPDICGDQAWDCAQGFCECKESDIEPFNECSDGCEQECPGASRTSGCENNGNKCICHYEDVESECANNGCSRICGDLRSDCVNDRCECYEWECDSDGNCDSSRGSEPITREDPCADCGSQCGDKAWDCNDGYCKCHEFDDTGGTGGDPCAAVYCGDNYYCDNGQCIFDGPTAPVDDPCDTCASDCGGLRWDCTGGDCQCFDDTPEPEPEPIKEPEPEPEPEPEHKEEPITETTP